MGQIIIRIKKNDAMWRIISIRLTWEQHKKLKKASRKHNISIANIIRNLVDQL